MVGVAGTIRISNSSLPAAEKPTALTQVIDAAGFPRLTGLIPSSAFPRILTGPIRWVRRGFSICPNPCESRPPTDARQAAMNLFGNPQVPHFRAPGVTGITTIALEHYD